MTAMMLEKGLYMPYGRDEEKRLYVPYGKNDCT